MLNESSLLESALLVTERKKAGIRSGPNLREAWVSVRMRPRQRSSKRMPLQLSTHSSKRLYVS
jgi:hypothetical protein